MSETKSKAQASLSSGEVVADKYKIESVLGQGGMGFVYAAEHLQLGHRVALKVLRASAAENPEAIQRFIREGRAVARLKSEHIAAVSDVGQTAAGEPFLVMELLEGRDLSHELQDRPTLPLEEAVDYMLQTCEALAVAHGKGIVHRDLKPANLYLTTRPDGEPLIKVLDFGISKTNAIDSEAAAITVTATIVGTPKYMSPEQIQDSRGVDHRADIWALGVIFYEILTAVRPFHAPTLAMTCVKILNEQPPPPSAHRPELPEAIDRIIARCIEKSPEARWQNVAQLAEALLPFASPSMAPVVARIGRIVSGTTSSDLRMTGMRVDASGAFNAARTDSGRIVGDPSPSSGQRLYDSGSGRTPSTARPVSDAASQPTLESGAVHPGLAQPEPKKRNGLWIGIALAAVAITVLVVALRSGPEAGGSKLSPGAGEKPSAAASDKNAATKPSAAESSTATATPAASTTTEAPKPIEATSASATSKPANVATPVVHGGGGGRPSVTKPTAPTASASTAPVVPVAPTVKPITGDPNLDDRR